MNSLILGLFLLVGMVWALCECCLVAGNGNWVPLILFLIVFLGAFSVMGCLDVSDATVNVLGAVTSIIMGVALLAFSLGSFQMNVGVGVLKLLCSLTFVAAGVVSFLPKRSHGH